MPCPFAPPPNPAPVCDCQCLHKIVILRISRRQRVERFRIPPRCKIVCAFSQRYRLGAIARARVRCRCQQPRRPGKRSHILGFQCQRLAPVRKSVRALSQGLKSRRQRLFARHKPRPEFKRLLKLRQRLIRVPC